MWQATRNGAILGLLVAALAILLVFVPALARGYVLALLPLLAAGPVAVRGGPARPVALLARGFAAGLAAAIVAVAGLLFAVNGLGSGLWTLIGPASYAPMPPLPRPRVLPGVPWPHEDILLLLPPLSAVTALVYGTLIAPPRAGLVPILERWLAAMRASIETKLVWLLLALALFTGVLGWVGFSALEDIHLRGHELQLRLDLIAHADALADDIDAMATSAEIPDPTARATAVDERSAAVARALAHLEQVPAHPGIAAGVADRLALAQRYADSVAGLRAAFERLGAAARDGVTGGPARAPAVREATVAAREAQGAFADRVQADTRERLDHTDLQHHASLMALVLLVLTAALAGAVLGQAAAATITRPVGAVVGHVARIGGGDFTPRLAIANRDELGELASRLNTMTGELDHLYSAQREGRRRAETMAAELAEKNTALESTRHALEAARDDLEQRVEERTATVRATNDQLVAEVARRRATEAQLLHDAFHDALTGLPNRALFMDRLGRLVDRARRRPDYAFAVLWLDLDRFKLVNDSLGHLVGDELLVQMARRLESSLRHGDTVARVGGDEFTFLLEDIRDVSEAIVVANRIQDALTTPFNVAGQDVFTTASIGIALSGRATEQGEDLLRDADTAMYRAKANGRARHEVFDVRMHANAVALLRMETDLRQALERQDFLVYYQPIVALADGVPMSFEALVRWQHPSRGLVSPVEFIPVAEETGLIVPLGEVVLRTACQQLRAWQETYGITPPLSVSVNLASRQLLHPDLPRQIGQVLAETGLAGDRLRVEVTESALLENIDLGAAALHQLRAMGVQVSIDDFGTGYSSLSYLHRLPIDTLKVDRSFVAGLGDDDESAAIVRAIVTLAHSLGMAVVAEGIETSVQLAQLRALSCDAGQGYYFYHPLPAAQAGEVVASVAGGAARVVR